MKRAHLSARTREILHLYQEHGSTRAVAELIGCTQGGVNYHLKKALGDRARRGQCARQHDRVVRLARDGATLQGIADAIGTGKRQVSAYVRKHRIERPPHRQHPDASPMSRNTRGSNNPAWSGGQSVDKQGYVLVYSPEHPNRNRHNQVRRHRLVMEEKLGRYLDPAEVVHHLNGKPGDDRPENLGLYASNGEHLRETMTGVPCPARANRRKSSRAM